MIIENRKSNGDFTGRALEVKFVKSEAGENGIGMGILNVVTEGVPGTSDGFRTYKRRKQTKLTCGSECKGNGKIHVEASGQFVTVEETLHLLRGSNSCDHVHPPMVNLDESPDDLWRSVFSKQMCHLSSVNGDNVPMCVNDGLATNSGANDPSRFRKFDAQDANSNNDLARTGSVSSTVQMASHRENGVVSNGSLENPDRCSVNESCWRAFLSIIDSQKFISLCKLLSENFRGIKADNVFDFSLVNSRIKEGAYENSPTLFLSDIWRKFQAIGTELVSLAESLSDFSRTTYREKVGVSGRNVFEDGKHESSTWESPSHAKAEHMDGYGAYKVCACRSCGEKAEGINCLVCDSCEEIYHISCIKPPVKEIPLKSWYCASCTGSGFSLRHDNCVVCERLNTPTMLANGVGEILETSEHNHFHGDDNPNYCTDDGFEQLKDSQDLGPCKICGNGVEGGDKYRMCSHLFCPHQFYHTRCLTKNQLKSYDTCWYCPSCLCRACLINQDDDKIVLCDGCDHGYHIYCMRPPLAAIPKGQWFCSKCEAGIQAIRRVKMAYENFENKRSKRGKDTFGKSGKKRINGGDEESDTGRGGMDMLLTAAKTLNYEEEHCLYGISLRSSSYGISLRSSSYGISLRSSSYGISLRSSSYGISLRSSSYGISLRSSSYGISLRSSSYGISLRSSSYGIS
ncbi:PHD finger protein EHD3 [Cucurbita argyrosperma subsp. argyrosperma]|nr:PHD finger protein EHD3 [Cucurbita argyrosperma subsp. argyrosperma]